MTTIGWILSLVGGFGLAGVIAFYIFAPLLAFAAWQSFLRLIEATLSTRIGCAALALGAGLLLGDLYGSQVEFNKCDAERLRIEAAAAARDREQGELADTDASKRLTELLAQQRKDKELIDAYAKALAGRPNNSCLLTPDDLR